MELTELSVRSVPPHPPIGLGVDVAAGGCNTADVAKDLEREAEIRRTRLREIGARICTARTAKEWSREQLAVAAGIPYPSIAAYESGKREPGVFAMEQIAAALGVSMGELVTGSDAPKDAAAPKDTHHVGTLAAPAESPSKRRKTH